MAAALVPLRRPVGVMAMLGLIVLAGVAVNDAILLAATARRLIGAHRHRRHPGVDETASLLVLPCLYLLVERLRPERGA